MRMIFPRSARAQGVKIPDSIRLRAEEVIE
jgi:hypothetical protein